MDSKNNPYLSLHSKYNPEAEAERYINSLELNDNIKYFILIEPGEGYMIPVLKKKFPYSKIIALHVNDPDSEKKLERELPALNAFHVKIIEWRPSMDFYKEDYVKLLSMAAKYIKQLDAEKRTISTFGKRWVRNFFRNLNNTSSILLYKETDIPVIITGSGPSLEQVMPVIKEAETRCLIIAASSSVMALMHSGVKPDLVIATDGGNWALKHLYNFLKNEKPSEIPSMAVNLCAALPSQCEFIPKLILNNGSLWQGIVLNELQLPSILIPERGTVTASAVELALQLSGGNIFLAGVDLSVKDIRTHAKPYAFDNLLMEKSNRLIPLYSQSFFRSIALKEGGSMEIYQRWFKKQHEKWPKRIHEIKDIKEEIKYKKEKCFKAMPVKLTRTGTDILLSALNGKYEEQLRSELEPLLGKDIESFLKEITEARSGST